MVSPLFTGYFSRQISYRYTEYRVVCAGFVVAVEGIENRWKTKGMTGEQWAQVEVKMLFRFVMSKGVSGKRGLSLVEFVTFLPFLKTLKIISREKTNFTVGNIDFISFWLIQLGEKRRQSCKSYFTLNSSLLRASCWWHEKKLNSVE